MTLGNILYFRNPENEKWKGTLAAYGVTDEVISVMSGTDDDGDFSILMDFFCNRWAGRSGNLDGCRIYIHPDNADALNVFRATGPDWRQSDMESAMRLSGVDDMRDCWRRVMFLVGEFRRLKSYKPQ
jgi:hypothetical protein